MVTRNASRRPPSRASPNTRGSRPRVIPVAKAANAWPVSWSAIAPSRSVVVVSSTVMPPAATRSRAESASRAEPRADRTAWARPSASTPRPAAAATSATSDSNCSADKRFNSRCWDRLRIVSTTL